MNTVEVFLLVFAYTVLDLMIGIAIGRSAFGGWRSK